MCTFTFFSAEDDSFFFNVNRDESPLRPKAKLPKKYFIENKKLFYPKDPQGGGSWICVNAGQQVACLMNGAFEKHKRELPYKKSRGLVLIDFMSSSDKLTFFNDYDLEGIEPFTIVFFDIKQGLFDFRWDSKDLHIKNEDSKKPHIISSSALFSNSQKKEREHWLEKFLGEIKKPDFNSIKNFHLEAGMENPLNAVCLNRFAIVASVSFCSINITKENTIFYYKDLLDGEEKSIII
ncbi:MAG: hypothetical protein EA412_05070 [Chitinophagaceae bacterium]|nr:MAG: hypothetical protein EA412_05070 [Chitinophagaceae bacterium]